MSSIQLDVFLEIDLVLLTDVRGGEGKVISPLDVELEEVNQFGRFIYILKYLIMTSSVYLH